MRPEARVTTREALQVETDSRHADRAVREGEMEGALHVVGERGFRDASVRAVLEYSGGHRKQFYEHFDSFEDCFQQAYASWIERLGVELLEAAVAVDGWTASARAGLVRLFEFIGERPAIARALFVEVQVAGGEALSVHDDAIERLVVALDSVRTEIDPGQEPPEATGLFVVGGIEAYVCEVLSAGDAKRVWDGLPELMHLAVGSYLGNAAAEEEFEAAREMLARDRAEPSGERE